MKKYIVLILLLASMTAIAQKNTTPTEILKISGKIKSEVTFTLASLDTFKTNDIGDLTITNHLGEIQRTAKNLKGFLLKNLFSKLEFQVENYRQLNKFYFIFVASDGYKVVFSWNEIFNSEIGNNLYLITEIDGKNIKEMPQRILVASTKDITTGRRYIKYLEKIIVEQVE